MKFVLDASIAVDFLLYRRPFHHKIAHALTHASVLAAPHLLDVEVANVIRRFVLHGDLSDHHARQVTADLADLPCQRYSHDALLQRIFELRHNLTAYDASYLALAEGLDATLITRDKAFLTVPDTSIRIQLITADS